ncbi:MAG: ATP-binding protein [Planctomycetota bacterium]
MTSSDDQQNECQALRQQCEELRAENQRLRLEKTEVVSANVHAAMQLVEMTEQRTLDLEVQNKEIARALAAAEEASKQKSRFLANMSHELRTPISGIIGMSELIMAGQLSEQQRDRVRAVVTTAESFLDLVNQVLNFSKAEAEAIELEHERFDLWETCESVVQLLHVQAEDKGVELLFDLCPTLPRYVLGDRVRLRQVLLNLGANAVKFTDSGFVSLSARCAEESCASTIFEVGDTGRGFDRDVAERLFQPFVQADASTTRRYGGTGLGLTISRQFVELMGGEITCSSTPGEGSVFAARVPLKRARVASGAADAGADAARAAPADVAGPPRTAHILASRFNTLRLLSGHLEELGLRVVLDDLRGLQPSDLLFVEASTDSQAVLRSIRAANVDNPIVLIETPAAVHDDDTYEGLGVVGIMQQPVRPTELSRVLAAAMAPAQPKDGGDAAEPAALRASGRSVLVADDSPINRRVLAERLRQMGCAVVEVADGQQAAEMFARESFDLVFLDCQMPIVDGYTAAQNMRKHELQQGDARTPIVALTADASSGNEQYCLASGMDMFCIKPLRAKQVADVLRRWDLVG